MRLRPAALRRRQPVGDTAYVLTFGGLLPRRTVGDAIGHKRAFISGLVQSSRAPGVGHRRPVAIAPVPCRHGVAVAAPTGLARSPLPMLSARPQPGMAISAAMQGLGWLGGPDRMSWRWRLINLPGSSISDRLTWLRRPATSGSLTSPVCLATAWAVRWLCWCSPVSLRGWVDAWVIGAGVRRCCSWRSVRERRRPPAGAAVALPRPQPGGQIPCLVASGRRRPADPDRDDRPRPSRDVASYSALHRDRFIPFALAPGFGNLLTAGWRPAIAPRWADHRRHLRAGVMIYGLPLNRSISVSLPHDVRCRSWLAASVSGSFLWCRFRRVRWPTSGLARSGSISAITLMVLTGGPLVLVIIQAVQTCAPLPRRQPPAWCPR